MSGDQTDVAGDMASSGALSELLAKQACVELVYRLARAIDRYDMAAVTALFHPDGTDDHGVFKGGVEGFVAWLQSMLDTMERTQHFIGNVLIEVDGDLAFGESYFVASHDLVDATGLPIRSTFAGRYLDRFERRDGQWKYAHHASVSDWSAWEKRTDVWDRDSDGPRRFGQRGLTDPVYSEAMLPGKTGKRR